MVVGMVGGPNRAARGTAVLHRCARVAARSGKSRSVGAGR